MESATLLEKEPSVIPSKKPCILVVDDNPDVLNYAGSTLRRYNYTVYSAHCALFALSVYRRHAAEIEILLTDVKMPDFSGPELADKLLLLNPELKVVYMSGQNSAELGSFGFLRKPFTSQELLQAVQSRGDAAAA
jgi:CheY-like chemotaxis protein